MVTKPIGNENGSEGSLPNEKSGDFLNLHICEPFLPKEIYIQPQVLTTYKTGTQM